MREEIEDLTYYEDTCPRDSYMEWTCVQATPVNLPQATLTDDAIGKSRGWCACARWGC